MGDWYLGPHGRWVYDPDAAEPEPSQSDVTAIEMTPVRALHDNGGDHEQIPERIDDWCENRGPDELTDDDEID